jgi:hypothetical protein
MAQHLLLLLPLPHRLQPLRLWLQLLRPFKLPHLQLR